MVRVSICDTPALSHDQVLKKGLSKRSINSEPFGPTDNGKYRAEQAMVSQAGAAHEIFITTHPAQATESRVESAGTLDSWL